jgi:hypothetical protein
MNYVFVTGISSAENVLFDDIRFLHECLLNLFSIECYRGGTGMFLFDLVYSKTGSFR